MGAYSTVEELEAQVKSRKKFFKKVNAEKVQNDRISALEKRVAELEKRLMPQTVYIPYIQQVLPPPPQPYSDGAGSPWKPQIWCSTSSPPTEYPKGMD